MILFVTYTFFNEVLPYLVEQQGPVRAYATVFFGMYLLFALLFNYLSVTWVGPGHPPADLDEQTRAHLFDDPSRRPNAPLRYCQKCKNLKGMRTHHCSLCRRCVMKMDHHCPWVNNCVGYRNHKYFLLFLFYLTVGAVFFLLTSSTQVYRVFKGQAVTGTFLFAAVLCLASSIASFFFLLWNIILVVTNQTTIEFITNFSQREKNVYHLGYRRNLEEVFGDPRWYTWLLPSRAPPLGDGIVFPLFNHETKEFRYLNGKRVDTLV
jgi:palmitoyltransferase